MINNKIWKPLILTNERTELEANSGGGINNPPKWYKIDFKLKTSDQQQQQETLSKLKQSLQKDTFHTFPLKP